MGQYIFGDIHVSTNISMEEHQAFYILTSTFEMTIDLFLLHLPWSYNGNIDMQLNTLGWLCGSAVNL